MLDYNNKLYLKYSSLSTEEKIIYSQQLKKFLRKLSWEYPGFWKWYDSLFSAKVELKPNREIIICESCFQLVGVAILKRDIEEKKICTLRVEKDFQRQGIGRKLFELSFEWLNCDKPLITVRQSKNCEFQKLFDYYCFNAEEKRRNYYQLFSTEVVYNGSLPAKGFELNQIEIFDLEKSIRQYLLSGEKSFAAFLDRWIYKIWQQAQIRDRRIRSY